MELTDKQWKCIKGLFPKEELSTDRRSGRPFRNPRDVLDAVMWILRTGAPWRDLPERYPSYQTCHRRFQSWVRNGILERILVAIAEDLRKRGGLDLTECFIDGSFASAKKGAKKSVRRSVAKDYGPCGRQWSSYLRGD